MLQFDNGFIMLCNNSTEEECLKRNLFGDAGRRLQDLDQIMPGDIGLLLNFEKDELIGIFKARSKACLNRDPRAWGGKFSAQVSVEPVGELQRIKDAAYILRKAGIGMKQTDLGSPVPQFPVHERITIEKVLAFFKRPTE